MTATTDTPVVAGAATDLWPHQADAINFASQRPAVLLAHSMGAGKSRTAIELCTYDRRVALARGHGRFRVLILCPKSVVGVWPGQFAQHGHSEWRVWAGDVHGSSGKLLANPSVDRRATALIQADGDAIKVHQPFVAVVNYEAAHHGDLARATVGIPWDVVILDESHRLKSPSGRTSKHVAHVCSRVRGSNGRIVALTGTPMPHSPLDLWGQMRALDGGQRLGTSYHRFCHQYGAGEEIYVAGGIKRTVYKGIRDDRRTEFTARVAPVIHQVTEADLDSRLGLPDAVDAYRTCQLPPKARKAYDELEKHLIAEVDGRTVTAANAMVLVLRLAQAASGFAVDADTGAWVPLADGAPDGKAALLDDLLDDLPAREPVVVFCRFHHDLDQVQAVAAARGLRYAELSGRRRDGLTADATMSPDCDVLGVQIRSGGVGVDLTRARVAVFYSLSFELADWLQARKRLHRPGQTRPVTYVTLLAEGTVDRAIYGALKARRETVDAVLAHIQQQKGARP